MKDTLWIELPRLVNTNEYHNIFFKKETEYILIFWLKKVEAAKCLPVHQCTSKLYFLVLLGIKPISII